MAIFGRKREDGPGAPASDPMGAPEASSTATQDADFGVPPFRPVPKDTTAVSLPPKPATPPTTATRPLPSPVSTGAGASIGASRPLRPTAPDAAERRTLVVGRGISLQGTVSDAERLVVEGTVESEMIQATELNVAQSGVFRGEVQVEDAEIAGLFDGTITVRGNLVIRATGKVNGTARYRKLSVEEGGVVSGRMETITESAPTRPLGASMPSGQPADAEA